MGSNELFSERGLSKAAALAACMVAAALAAWLIYIAERTPPPPVPAGILQEVNIDELPDIGSAMLRAEGLETALERSLQYVRGLPPEKLMPFGDDKISASELREGLEAFLKLLKESPADKEFRKELGRQFHIYRMSRCRADECVESPAPVLVTGYFQPEISASFQKTPDYTYPLYAIPEDLLQIDLRQFDPALPPVRLFGRVAGRKVVPYYSRSEIDGSGMTLDARVLAWIPDEIDGLMLHIQGSGLLKFQDGEHRYIHFAASNGRPYGSIGKWLIKKGWLTPQDADWPGIKRWARAHPDKFRQALAANPRYIFFRWEKEGPVGSMGSVLVPMCSAAMDPVHIAQGALCLLDIDAPTPHGFRGFVLNQDRGSAIKGPCRVDLYCGEGDEAGRIAGTLRHRGNLYLFRKRQTD